MPVCMLSHFSALMVTVSFLQNGKPKYTSPLTSHLGNSVFITATEKELIEKAVPSEVLL